MDQNQIRDTLGTLEHELHRLTARLQGEALRAPEVQALSLAEADRGKDLFDQVQATESRESHFASRDRIVDRLHRVNAAIRRVHDGTYGDCVECGNAIAPARLRAIPEVTTCVACQEELERLGRTRDAQSGMGAIDLADEHPEAPRRRVDLDDTQSTGEILESLGEPVTSDGDRESSGARTAARARGRGASHHGRTREVRGQRPNARATRGRSRQPAEVV
jgi:RNA polymerase-binding transcription factor DksA